MKASTSCHIGSSAAVVALIVVGLALAVPITIWIEQYIPDMPGWAKVSVTVALVVPLLWVANWLRRDLFKECMTHKGMAAE